jgi:hypothetical protein
MQAHTACMLRNSIRQGARRILAALVLAFVVFLLSARPALAQGTSTEKITLDKLLSILGQVEVHLVYTDADGKQQDVSLAQASPELLAKLPLPLRVESKLPILQPKVSYFDGLWGLYREPICKDTIPEIQQSNPPGSNNTAYNISCRPFKFGFMQAYIVPKAPDYFIQYREGAQVIPAGGYPTNTVQQLDIEFTAPANAASYTLTTSCTCHSSNIFCNKDPQFTIPFTIVIIVKANSTQQNSLLFGSNPMMQVGYLAEGNGLLMMGGDAYGRQAVAVEQQLESSLESSLTMLAMTDGASIFGFIEKLFEDLFKYGIGGLYEMTCINSVYNPVTEKTGGGTFNSANAQKMANQADEAFRTLFIALNSGNAVGFSQLDLAKGKGDGLRFELTDTPAKPTISGSGGANKAAQNGIHLVTPSIGTGGQQLKPGVPFLVSGTNFPYTETGRITVSWDRTLSVVGKSTLKWGPKGGTMQPVTLVTTDTYSPIGLSFTTPTTIKASTPYQFQVQECDTIACSPWSDPLEATADAAGNDNVKLWLDNDTSKSIGTGAVALEGGFEAQVTIPSGTAPGTHTINAAKSGNTPEASVQVTVAGQGAAGSTATISIIDTGTRAAMTPPVNLAYPTTFPLRGDGFAPGVMVAVYIDGAAGTQLGTATPNAAGSFLANINLPTAQPGLHKLVAVQVNGGSTIQASVAVDFMSQPK